MKLLPLLLAFTLPLSGIVAAPLAQFSGQDPVIVQMIGRMVRVRVPAGFDHVTLQTLVAPPKGRVAPGRAAQPEWKTVGMQFTGGKRKDVRFTVARLTGKRNLRALGSKADRLPGSLLTGISTFLPDPETTGAAANLRSGTPTLSDSDTAVTSSAATNSLASTSAAKSTATRDVVESDIWKLTGDRLYFFNQYRGLQVFDVSNPDDPALLGTLRMPAVGDDMYVLDADHAVLLKKSNSWSFNYFYDGGPILFRANPLVLANGVSLASDDVVTASPTLSLTASSSVVRSASLIYRPQAQAAQTSEVVLTDMSSGHPEILSRLPFDGTLRESRLVGDVLYVASDVYNSATDTTAAQWGMQLTSFDLSDRANPIQRGKVFLGGWANAVMATDHFFLAAKWSGNGNTVDLIDISDASGAMAQAGQVSVDGNVEDKFKMHVEGDVLTVVSQAWKQTANTVVWWNQTPVTKVATFSLADAVRPSALGNLELAEGENLYATRFDGDRLYVVTATRVIYPMDPLWIVDLSAPEKPAVLGQLDIPGFSTYVAPLGDRLVSIGLVNWQPAVSLFDVSDPAKPALLTRISLATQNGWSYTEATWSEKAFSVLPDDNLILIPISGYDSKNGESNGVQIVDLFEDKLVKRGLIAASITPRRATLHRDRILSISAKHLVSVDASDRDKPAVKADLEIAWSVDRVFSIGKYLVQLGRDGWSQNSATTLTVSPSDDADQSLATAALPGFSVVGTAVRDGVLHVLQYRNQYDVTSDVSVTTVTAKPALILTTFDVAHLPKIAQLGQKTVPLTEDSWNWGTAAQPLWPTPTTLVWAQQIYGNSWWRPIRSASPVPTTETTPSDDTVKSANLVAIRLPGYWSQQWLNSWSQRLIAFDVTRPEAPAHLSTKEIGAGEAWQVAAPLAADGTIYVSHKELGRGLHPDSDWNVDQAQKAEASAKTAQPDTLRNRHFLQVIEYGDAAKPFTRPDQINIPGRLVGLAQNGKLLLTLGQSYHLATHAARPAVTALQTSAFDGVAAYLIDVLPLANDGQPFALAGSTLFVLKAEPAQIWKPTPNQPSGYYWWGGTYETNPNLSELRTLSLTAEGKFAELGKLTLVHETSLHLFGGLAVAQDSSRSLHLIDASKPDALGDLGTFQFEGWVWPNLDDADGALDRGLWVPLGEYGIEAVPVPAN